MGMVSDRRPERLVTLFALVSPLLSEPAMLEKLVLAEGLTGRRSSSGNAPRSRRKYRSSVGKTTAQLSLLPTASSSGFPSRGGADGGFDVEAGCMEGGVTEAVEWS